MQNLKTETLQANFVKLTLHWYGRVLYMDSIRIPLRAQAKEDLQKREGKDGTE